MISRKELERRESNTLASYAVRSADSRGRRFPEPEDEWRTVYQRDRDRILHSTAFRRLQYKTQVFFNEEGDHYRTRLTHTLEVSQIARSIARTLSLNEDLAETLALAHDLGHGPFGHAGEEALRDLMKFSGGFDHNLQTLRIVEDLEESYPDFSGLNLTFEVTEGLKKHTQSRCFSLEAQVVDLADEIAYNSHDLDDGLRSGLIREEELGKLALTCEIDERIRKEFKTSVTRLQYRRMAIRFLVDAQVKDASRTSLERIQKRGIKDLKDALSNRSLVDFSPAFKKKVRALKRFLMRRFYKNEAVLAMTKRGKRWLAELFRTYLKRPGEMPFYAKDRVRKYGLKRAVCDYIAGMTDRFAQQEYRRLFLSDGKKAPSGQPPK